jgi:hypothetical protein
MSIGNAGIAPLTGRLDVLPDDVNDTGIVTLQDALIVRNYYLNIGAVTIPNTFLDVNGDGVVDINDYNQSRRFIGSHRPRVKGVGQRSAMARPFPARALTTTSVPCSGASPSFP